jgi:penicillin-binding protein 1C
VVARACARASARALAVECAAIRGAADAMLAGDAVPAPVFASGVHLAPQLARALLRDPGERVRTTLDAGVQRIAVAALSQQLDGLRGRNVRDGAALVVDNETGDVLAYVASAGGSSRAREVDGVRARRQAGSTLKPFLYQLALERDYLTAASLLDDSPIAIDTRSGIYLPQNYDRDFKGLVSVRTALGSSLNVPAVRALVLVGVEPFRDRLRALGYAGLVQPGEFYGYALALGSAEVSLWEQVQAYRALARGGRWSPIHTIAESQPDAPLLAEDAAFIVADILADPAARSVTFGLDSVLSTPFWTAVKTGTSKDMRDNWCIGFSRAFTVGVWVGNFEGDAMHDVSGVSGAAPAWQEIMEALHARVPSRPPAAPPGVVPARARFAPEVEPPRDELFARGRGEPADTIEVAGELARIASPAAGMVIALDPDIPPRLQRVPLRARGARDGMVLRLNGAVIGPAEREVMWAPERGAWQLAVEDASGRTLDSARFSVR